MSRKLLLHKIPANFKIFHTMTIYLVNPFQIKAILKPTLKLLLLWIKMIKPTLQVNSKTLAAKMKILKIKEAHLNSWTNKSKITNKSIFKAVARGKWISVLLSKFPSIWTSKHFYKMSFKMERMKIHNQINSFSLTLMHKMISIDKVLLLDSETKARKVLVKELK